MTAMTTPAREQIQLPDDERGVSPDVVARFDRLNAKLGRRDLSPKQREATAAELAALEATPAKRADRAWLEATQAETEMLALARGEGVERSRSGQIRIDRDPILSLMRCGHLTAEQFDTATEFRALYEARQSGIGAMNYGDAGGGVHNNDRFVFVKLQAAKAAQRIGTAERRIALECRDEPAALQMFRGVIGEGKALSSFGKGRAFERNLSALVRALTSAS